MRDNKCVHMDFHTSEKIKGIGADFNAEEFKTCIQKAGLDSITLFAKCHHGCFYYEDTKFFKHPYLCGSLLDKQVQACKEIGVSSKIYISAGLDEATAREHPEWLMCWTRDQQHGPATGFRRLCFNTPYLELLKEQTKEVVRKYMPDGVFFDIVADVPCRCKWCIEDMRKKGLDPDKGEDVWKQAKDVFNKYANAMTETVKSIKPDCMVFQNCGDFPVGRHDRMDCCDQLEAESLPTGGWGYDHFPLSMAYLRRRGKNCIGMTGKFHKSWGEFGGFKYKNALKYEAAQCNAFDAGFCVGDQLHPSGKMDLYTYENIGAANAYVKAFEPWRGGECIAEAAIYSPKASEGRTGLSRILFEEKILFDLIDEEEISNRYALIILADDEELSAEAYTKFKSYIANGGKILAMGKNALYNGKEAFDLGFTFQGEDDQVPCYVRANYELRYANQMALVAYEKAYVIQSTGKVLADKISPYFARHDDWFCSHLHTPCDYDKVSPAITEGADGIYIATNLFAQYAKDGSLTARQLISPLLDTLLKARTITTDLPTSGKAILYAKNDNTVCHLLYANTIKRGDGVEIIEDIVTLANVRVSVKSDKKPEKVVLQPQGKAVDFRYENGRVDFETGNFHCYQIAEIQY